LSAALASIAPPRDALDLRFRGRCVGGDVDLSRYPNLVYAPLQHGEGVRTASNGVPVVVIAGLADQGGLVELLDGLTAVHGATFGEVLDALDYARANGMI
jgi:hypothetical protein